MGRLRVSIAGLMGLVLAVAVGFASLRYATAAWAGVVLLATLAALTLAILGVVYRRGAGRAFWLGFALLGWGYMALASESWWDRNVDRAELATTILLDRLFPLFEPDRAFEVPTTSFARWLTGLDPRTQAIITELDKPIPMPFGVETPLADVLKWIKQSTITPTLPDGIPIYLDPISLQEADKSESTPVKLNLEAVPLRRTLTLLLDQLDLSYHVRNGLLTIDAAQHDEAALDAFRRIGHGLFALLAAVLGGIAGRIFHATGERRGAGAPA